MPEPEPETCFATDGSSDSCTDNISHLALVFHLYKRQIFSDIPEKINSAASNYGVLIQSTNDICTYFNHGTSIDTLPLDDSDYPCNQSFPHTKSASVWLSNTYGEQAKLIVSIPLTDNLFPKTCMYSGVSYHITGGRKVARPWCTFDRRADTVYLSDADQAHLDALTVPLSLVAADRELHSQLFFFPATISYCGVLLTGTPDSSLACNSIENSRRTDIRSYGQFDYRLNESRITPFKNSISSYWGEPPFRIIFTRECSDLNCERSHKVVRVTVGSLYRALGGS